MQVFREVVDRIELLMLGLEIKYFLHYAAPHKLFKAGGGNAHQR